MKFNKLIAIVAIISLAVQANAQDGALRRTTVAQNDVNTESAAESKQNVIINVTPSATASQQPATVVEAQPVVESKAEKMRKARQEAEVNTEQKIVEKLEESRLKEEQERADRLFGTKLDAAANAQLEEAVKKSEVAPVAPAPVPVAPTQVTIEKVEIVQPAPAPLAPPEIKSITPVEEVQPSAPVAPAAPVAKSSLAIEEEAPAPKANQFYVNGSLGGMSYDASNVKSNIAGGFAVGNLMNEQVAVEASFLYSNHYIDTFWNPGIYRELDQYDLGASAKYYILKGTQLKPYVGAGAAYIIRNYSQRIITNNGYQTTTIDGRSEEQTESLNLNLTAGLDFKLNQTFMIGGGVDYSMNLWNKSEFDFANYYTSLPADTKALEEINFWTVKATATVTF
jgi:outer membrane protein W